MKLCLLYKYLLWHKRQTDREKYSQNRYLYLREMCKEKITCVSQLQVEKIAFPYFYISVFCSLTDILTDKIFTEYMLIGKRNLHRKKGLYLNQRLKKSSLPLNLTDGRTLVVTEQLKIPTSILYSSREIHIYIVLLFAFCSLANRLKNKK